MAHAGNGFTQATHHGLISSRDPPPVITFTLPIRKATAYIQGDAMLRHAWLVHPGLATSSMGMLPYQQNRSSIVDVSTRRPMHQSQKKKRKRQTGQKHQLDSIDRQRPFYFYRITEKCAHTKEDEAFLSVLTKRRGGFFRSGHEEPITKPQ